MIVVCWYPCMVINLNEQYNNGGFLPDILLMIQAPQAPIVVWLDGIINYVYYYYLFNYCVLYCLLSI